jgi:hypothetical protein
LEEKMKTKTIIVITVIAFTFSCGLTEKLGRKEEPAKDEIQKEEVAKQEPAKEEPIAEPAPQKVESTPEPVVPPPQMVSVMVSVVNIRSGPGMKNKVITTVKRGDEMELLGETGSWCNVRLSTGVEGWIYKKLVR